MKCVHETMHHRKSTCTRCSCWCWRSSASFFQKSSLNIADVGPIGSATRQALLCMKSHQGTNSAKLLSMRKDGVIRLSETSHDADAVDVLVSDHVIDQFHFARKQFLQAVMDNLGRGHDFQTWNWSTRSRCLIPRICRSLEMSRSTATASVRWTYSLAIFPRSKPSKARQHNQAWLITTWL